MHLPRDTAPRDTAKRGRLAAIVAGTLLFAVASVPAGAADPTALAAPRPAHAPAKHPAPAPTRGTPSDPVIPPAALPGALSASPQPRGPLPLETKLLPLGSETGDTTGGGTAAPAQGGGQPAPEKTKPPAS
jgi:hypothetical protein